MDKYIESAESIKRRIASLEGKGGNFGASVLIQTDNEEYSDVVLDTKILICEFGNKALIDEVLKFQTLPELKVLSHLLDKLIATVSFRNKWPRQQQVPLLEFSRCP